MSAEERLPPAGRNRERDDLAKAWMLELIEASPLEDVAGIELGWFARGAPALIANLLGAAADPPAPPAPGPPIAGLARIRRGPGAGPLAARDLARLHVRLIGEVRRSTGGSGATELAPALARLAAALGSIQADLLDDLTRGAVRVGGRDAATGLAGTGDADDWLRAMVAAEERYGTPFSVLLVGIAGLGRAAGPGPDEADELLADLAARGPRPAFRLAGDELCLLLRGQGPIPSLALAERLAEPIGSRSAAVEARIGIASCPEHGRDAGALLAKAREASREARIGGEAVMIASGARPAWLQGR